jgi:outer membrane protein assembly factor BamB
MLFLAAGTAGACGGGGTGDDQNPLDPGSDGGTTSPGVDGRPPDPAVLTYHNDVGRTGANLAEKTLTPMAVQSRGMVEKFNRPVDGQVYAQLLYLPKLDIAGGTHDVVYAATTNNHLYAIDANDATASGTDDAGILWHLELEDPESSVRKYPRGILSTPVIDRGAGEMYVVFSTVDDLNEPTGESTRDVAFYLAAVDYRTGEVRRHVKVEGSVPRTSGATLAFLARNHRQRPALLLSKGSLYIGFGTRSKENLIEYHGWLFRYDAKTFERQAIWNATPDRNKPGQGGGIWGAAPAADGDGNVFFATGNALANLAGGSYGNAIVGLKPENGLSLLGAFTPEDPERRLEIFDVDLGSAGLMLIPGARQAVGGGKTGVLYLVDTTKVERVQEFQAFINQHDPDFVVDSYWAGGPHLHGAPVFWQGPDPKFAYVYHWSEYDFLKAFRYRWSDKRLEAEDPIVGDVLAVNGADRDEPVMPGGMISLSANGNADGIIWASIPETATRDPRFGEFPGRLIAFDAQTLSMIWDTSFPSIPKWMPPTVSDGKVFLPTSSNRIFVYELGPAW